MHKIVCLNNDDMILLVVSEIGTIRSDVVSIDKQEATLLLKCVKDVLDGKSDGMSLSCGDGFTFVEKSNSWVFSVKITERFYKGYDLNYKSLKLLNSELKKVLNQWQ